MMIETFDEAYQFVIEHKVCTVFGSKNSPYPSLWDNINLPTDKPAEGGWSPRVKAVWSWKTLIPQTYPDTIFYGKVPGGDAVLMEMEHLRNHHYPNHYQPVEMLDPLSKGVFELIRNEPWFTGELRQCAMDEFGCTKSRFDTALKKLQISLNIVRSNDPSLDRDQWLTFEEVYLDIVEMHRK